MESAKDNRNTFSGQQAQKCRTQIMPDPPPFGEHITCSLLVLVDPTNRPPFFSKVYLRPEQVESFPLTLIYKFSPNLPELPQSELAPYGAKVLASGKLQVIH